MSPAAARTPVLPLALACALLALPALAPAAAAEAALVDVRALALAADGASLSGPLSALELQGGEHDRGLLRLDARWMGLTYERDAIPYAGDQAQFDPRPQPAERAEFRNVTSGDAALAAHHDVYVLPLPGQPPPEVAAPDGGCAAVVPSRRGEVRPEPQTTGAEAHPGSAHVASALEWDDAACAARAWTVAGSFLLTLWEADLAFRHDGGEASYPTGKEYRGDPNLHNLTGTRWDAQLYLAVVDGQVAFEAGGAAVFLREAALEASSLRLGGGVHGAAPGLGDATLAGGSLVLSGRLRAAVAPADGELAVRVSGRLAGGAVDDQAVSVDAPGRLRPEAWMLGVVALPVAALAAAAWRGRPAAALARLEALSAAGLHGTVARRAARLRQAPDVGREASGLRVDALARTGRMAEALEEAARLPPAESALAQAYAHALAADRAACVAALRRCAELDPRWAAAALRDPAFAAMRDDPALRGLGLGLGFAGGAR